jgi:hypothetical protein
MKFWQPMKTEKTRSRCKTLPFRYLWKTNPEPLQKKPESCRSQGMTTFAPVEIPDKTTVMRCFELARANIRKLLESGLPDKTLHYALVWGFCDTLREFTGNDHQTAYADALYDRLPDAARADVPECRNRVQEILLMLRKQGFDAYTIALTIITALDVLCVKASFTEDDLTKQHRAALLQALHRAVKRQDPEAYRRASSRKAA